MAKRRRHSAKFKFKVALEAAQGTETFSELASEYQLHPSRTSAWKGDLLGSGPDVFSSRSARQKRQQAAREAELYEQIGRLKMELGWLKKSHRTRLRASVVQIPWPVTLLLRPSAGNAFEPGTDASYRRTVLEDALLRLPGHDRAPATPRVRGEREARAAPYAPDGSGSGGVALTNQRSLSRPHSLSLPAEWVENYPSQPGLEHRRAPVRASG